MSIAEQAKEIYEHELRDRLEAAHRDQYVAIEPISKAFFLGDTPLSASMSAKEAFLERMSFLLRIGHVAAIHIGAATS